ncbi:MAG: IS66 family insertion sequence element accessory protein TnpB [Rhodospirillales bacterium]|nr:IS66 family insertion sequence element accessory protein TnpB [Rhodospirillales bacterium]
MIPVPSGVRVWLAVGRTDMRKGMNGLALQVQEALGRDPHAGDLYVFRGARACPDGGLALPGDGDEPPRAHR